jgi:hypothetical protein
MSVHITNKQGIAVEIVWIYIVDNTYLKQINRAKLVKKYKSMQPYSKTI